MLPRLFLIDKKSCKLAYDGLTEAPRSYVFKGNPALEVTFHAEAKVMHLASIEALDEFTDQSSVDAYVEGQYDVRRIDWRGLAAAGWDAIVIAPYQPRARFRYAWTSYYPGGMLLTREAATLTEVAYEALPTFDPWYGAYDTLDPFRPEPVAERLLHVPSVDNDGTPSF